ncbi:MAG TPA: leucine--tRNA ligase [Planctomycetes bacterium]|nr:leucine--tRNA ligase [Planctomycetota bacterium]HIK59976.1 leucine--tRNA ligase [Planctomycetota bacterium]
MPQSYDPASIESKWQAYWETSCPFRALSPGEEGFQPDQEKYYVLDMFPYPSGAGLHVGHPMGYIGSDIVARKKRMQGFNVLHPMGFDAFGLPAEQYAIQTGMHPAQTTAENIANYERQLKMIGLSYDWSRSFSTSTPDYYRWTQWIFTRLYDRGLAYQAEVPVWWCEELKTVLSNEEVIDGRSERGDHPCERRPLRQWMLKITAYADRLIEDLDEVDWPASVKTMQREWIGRSEGAEIRFAVQGTEESLEVFTTRPDTLYGVTFMVLAPEHPLVGNVTSAEQRAEVEGYVQAASSKSELQRMEVSKEKTGVFTGAWALNPLMDPTDPGARLPIWVADYVLMGYGSGAIMCVPGHDDRDFEFATAFGLPVREVVRPADGGAAPESGCYLGHGISVNSPLWDGLTTPDAQLRATELIEERGLGEAKVNYRLRDWLFSRQRYWGEPFPVLHGEDGNHQRVRDEDLPVELPAMDDFAPPPDGSPPLSKATDWVQVTDPQTGESYLRDTDTMPGWAGSCWYYLRFMDANNSEAFASREALEYWNNVDLYIGGTEHAVLHLLYARFWHKVLYDEGLVPTKEPFQQLFNQGMVQAFAYKDASGRLVSADEVTVDGDEGRSKASGEVLEQVVAKMSKSLKNVVNPDVVCDEYGVDTFRLYEMFMGPLADSKPWNPRDVPGARRFLDRVWRLYVDPEGQDAIRPQLLEKDDEGAEPKGPALEVERGFHRCLARVEDSFKQFNFNTAVAAFMEFVNLATKNSVGFTRSQAERLACALAPFAPHLAEELWERLGHAGGITRAPWPSTDARYLEVDGFELVVQVNGKVRGRAQASKESGKQELEALAEGAVSQHLDGKERLKTIVVPGRLVNFVVR